MVVFEMRDWNLSLNYMMLVPAVYVALHLMKKNKEFTLWAEMLGFLILVFSIMLQIQIGYFSSLYIIAGSQLSGLMKDYGMSKVPNLKKFIWVTRKIPILTFVLGLTLGRTVDFDAAWIGLVIMSLAIIIQRLILTGWAKGPVISHIGLLILAIALYYNFLLLEGNTSVHTGTALVVVYWMGRAFQLSREHRCKN